MYKKEFILDQHKIVVEKNVLALNTDASFVLRWNDTVVLVTLCVSKNPIQNNFVPLTVEFQENLFSVAKIPGGFARREGRPSDFATLSARMIDRSIRGLFPKDFRYETQIFANSLSFDRSVDLTVVASLATSLTLNTSTLPINSCFASVTVGYINNQFVVNPKTTDLEKSDLDMFLTGNETMITMIEVSANELSETQILQAIKLGHEKIIALIKIQREVLNDIKIVKKDYLPLSSEIKIDFDLIIKQQFAESILHIVEKATNQERNDLWLDLENEVINYFLTKYGEDKLPKNWKNLILDALSSLIREKVRTYTITNQKRIDQRGFHDLRSLKAQIDYLPTVHGSALFNRGETQTLSIVTLGSLMKNKIIDDITENEKSYFLYHYNALPFSMGFVQRRHSVSRREIGHGHLGHKALKRLLPSIEDFPYTIRVFSEVIASNGSTSQASICSASLALFSAGVPLKKAVAGVAIGLIKQDNHYQLLSDIQAWEDFYGDMDFKIAGTNQGICSMQLDLKINGLPIDIIEKALIQGHQDRLQILEVMQKVIAQPRSQLADSAWKFDKITIKTENIALLIGPSGKNVKKIIADYDNPEIDIKDDGTVIIYHRNWDMVQKIKKHITGSLRPTAIGDVFDAVVTKIVEYGAFIKTKEGNIKGLIHISNLSKKFVNDINSVIKLNQEIKVEVISINERNQINFKRL